MMDENKGLSYFFLGLGVGVALGIVFAPKSGEQTRDMIRSKVDEGTDLIRRRSGEFAQVAKETATDYVERGRTAVTRQRDQFSAAVEAGKTAYRDAVSTATRTVESADLS